LTESLLLGGLGGIGGLVLARLALPFLSALAPSELPGFTTPELNLPAIGFALSSLLLATAVVGLAPAWWLSRINLTAFIQGGRTGTGGPGLTRTRNVLLVSQLALATMLLVGAGLLVRSMARLNRVELGFDSNGLLAASVNLPRTRYTTVAAQAAFYERVREKLAEMPEVGEKLAEMPEVASVGAISDPPLSSSSTFSFVIAGRPRPGSNPRENPVEIRAVSPSYFSTARLPLVEGRLFTSDDRAESPGVALVNRAFAKAYFPDKAAVGGRLSRIGPGGPWIEIVGVVADLKDEGPDVPSPPAIYVPYLQKGLVNLSGLTVVVRSARAPETLLEDIRRVFATIDPELPVRRLSTLDDLYSAHLASRTFVTRLTIGFAGLTVVLGIIGVYGTFSFSVAQRRREFGICLALGAAKRDILRQVVREGAKLIVVGTLAGMAGAVALGRFLETLLFEVGTVDPVTLASVVTSMAGVSLFALWWPARDAANADPLVALRSE
jgi:predicted permease